MQLQLGSWSHYCHTTTENTQIQDCRTAILFYTTHLSAALHHQLQPNPTQVPHHTSHCTYQPVLAVFWSANFANPVPSVSKQVACHIMSCHYAQNQPTGLWPVAGGRIRCQCGSVATDAGFGICALKIIYGCEKYLRYRTFQLTVRVRRLSTLEYTVSALTLCQFQHLLSTTRVSL